MLKSGILKKTVKKSLLETIIRECQEAGEITAATEDSGLDLKSRIEKLTLIQKSLSGAANNSTMLQYLQRIIFCLKAYSFVGVHPQKLRKT